MRRTTKYLRALEVFPDHQHDSNDDLYQKLIESNYYWDANVSRWMYTPGEKNDSASTQIKIRIWFDKNQVKEISELVVELLNNQGLRLIEQSEVYRCRPPKGNDGRIYLTFTR